MKSAEEWRKSRYFGNNSEDGIETIVQQIQLDAMKEGMRRAAVVAEGETYATGGIRNDEEASYEKGCLAAQKAILTTAEQLTEKDL